METTITGADIPIIPVEVTTETVTGQLGNTCTTKVAVIDATKLQLTASQVQEVFNATHNALA